MTYGLLGAKPSRKFKVFREEFPAIFRFDGTLYQEEFDIDTNESRWIEISEESAKRWLVEKPQLLVVADEEELNKAVERGWDPRDVVLPVLNQLEGRRYRRLTITWTAVERCDFDVMYRIQNDALVQGATVYLSDVAPPGEVPS